MVEATTPPDSWSGGDRYERYVGRWSRRVADRFLVWLAAPARLRWLDVGSGTGALTQAILRDCAPVEVTGVDSSPTFVAHAAAHVTDSRASFREGDAQALPLADGSVDVAVSGLVLNFIPDRDRALQEMRRVCAPDGLVAAYVWDYAGEMQFMRHFWAAAAELDPGSRDLDEGTRFPFARPEPLRQLFTAAGLANVSVEEIVVPTVFADFDDYWTPFLGGTGPAPAYTMSLDESARGALRKALAQRLPTDSDGSIALTARAWAVRGRVS